MGIPIMPFFLRFFSQKHTINVPKTGKQRFQIFHQSFGKPSTQQKRVNSSLRRVFSFNTQYNHAPKVDGYISTPKLPSFLDG
jgi:hypothetical protein